MSPHCTSSIKVKSIKTLKCHHCHLAFIFNHDTELPRAFLLSRIKYTINVHNCNLNLLCRNKNHHIHPQCLSVINF